LNDRVRVRMSNGRARYVVLECSVSLCLSTAFYWRWLDGEYFIVDAMLKGCSSIRDGEQNRIESYVSVAPQGYTTSIINCALPLIVLRRWRLAIHV
jgi:hypothetical protein